MQQSHLPDRKANQLPCKLVSQSQFIKERLLTIEQASDKVNQQSSGKYALRISYDHQHECRLAKQVQGDVRLGSVQVTYSNNALTTVSDVLIRCKEFPSFRDVNFVVGQSSDAVMLQNSMDLQQSVVEKQAYRMIWRHIEQGFIVRPNRRDSTVNRTNA